MPSFLLAPVLVGWIVIVLSIAGWRLDRRGAAERRADPDRTTLAAMRGGPKITITAAILGTAAMVTTAAWPVAAGPDSDEMLIAEWLAVTIALVGLVVVILMGAMTIVHLPRAIAPALVHAWSDRIEVHHRFRHTLDTVRFDAPYEISHGWHAIHRPRTRRPGNYFVTSIRRYVTLTQGATVIRLSVVEDWPPESIVESERIRRPAPWHRRAHIHRQTPGNELFDRLLKLRDGVGVRVDPHR